MTRSLLVTLRVLLVVLFAASLAAQIFSESIAAALLDGAPEVVLTAVIVAALLCVEVVLLGVWMLVTLVAREQIFDDRGRADRWVTAAIGALIAAGLVGAGACVYFAILAATWASAAAGEAGSGGGGVAATALTVAILGAAAV
ncbi:MAG: hypothetical protein JWQ64_2324, partial [Subtercola sp.]|nr:hypothetical protein [Subtercola sp.]